MVIHIYFNRYTKLIFLFITKATLILIVHRIQHSSSADKHYHGFAEIHLGTICYCVNGLQSAVTEPCINRYTEDCLSL